VRFYKIIFILLICTLKSFGQQSDGMSTNLRTFYKNPIHFGFDIMINKTDFRVHSVKTSNFPDTIIDNVDYRVKSVYNKGEPGFALGIVCDVRLHDYIRIRFVPNISFASRKLDFTLQNAKHDSTKIFTKAVESTFLIFPLEAKFQSKRLGNFSAYVIGGGGYALDLASNKRTASGGSGGNQLDDAIKIKRDDWFYSAGAGVDFYLQYFKFGMELKVLMGTRNLMYQQNNIFSKSIDKVQSRMVVFSLTFEG
jgi:hypothetical protein